MKLKLPKSENTPTGAERNGSLLLFAGRLSNNDDE